MSCDVRVVAIVCEIEELKRKYGMMSRTTVTSAPSHTTSAMQRYTSDVMRSTRPSVLRSTVSNVTRTPVLSTAASSAFRWRNSLLTS